MKLRELIISNYGCIGEKELNIRIDDIVVLIGPNNVGKSTVIKAYQDFVGTGSALPIEKFYKYSSDNAVSISGIFSDLSEEDTGKLGNKWIYNDEDYGDCIKYKWVWDKPDIEGKKFSWNEETKEWESGGMGGWDTKIASCVPQPMVINPFESSASLETKVIEILTTAIKKEVKTDNSKLTSLISEFEKIAQEVKKQVEATLNETTGALQSNLQEVFPGHEVSIRPEAGKIEPEKIIASGSHIRITDPSGDDYPLDRQGTGLQRAFLWSALGALSENNQYKAGKKAIGSDTPRILIIEEPEVFLHPPAIRAAREAVYKISALDNWQVLITTHSPVFIDVSKPHTTIVRVEKDRNGGSKTFSTELADFDENERKRLQILRSCHPTVNEFFFSDNIVLIEGDTELALLSEVLNRTRKQNSHKIVNCYGKANIPMFQKILNHFGIKYCVIHDTDSPQSKTKTGYRNNSMWSINQKIYDYSNGNTVVAHTPNLEAEYFKELPSGDKPYNAISTLDDAEFQKTDEYQRLVNIFEHIENETHPGLIKNENTYQELVESYKKKTDLDDEQIWEFNHA